MIKLISITQPQVEGIKTAEELIVYCARVSNPNNQLNTETAPKLIQYLIKHKHWSPFEMVNICFEVTTRRSISAQIIRHFSIKPQEFSQRYSEITVIQKIELRKKAIKNRQSSVNIVNNPFLNSLVSLHSKYSKWLYKFLIKNGVAKESARDILPLATQTTLYLNGSLRSWIHYLQVRTDETTQKEHRIIALEIEKQLKELFPNVFEALSNEF